jgi:hypothetical protein
LSGHTICKKRGRSPSVERNNFHRFETKRSHDEEIREFRKDDTYNIIRREGQQNDDFITCNELTRQKRTHDIDHRKEQWGLSNNNTSMEGDKFQASRQRQQTGRRQTLRDSAYSLTDRSSANPLPRRYNDRFDFHSCDHDRRNSQHSCRSRDEWEIFGDRRHRPIGAERRIGERMGYNERRTFHYVDTNRGNSSFLRYRERVHLRQDGASSFRDRDRNSCWDADIRLGKKLDSPQDRTLGNSGSNINHNDDKFCSRQSVLLGTCQQMPPKQEVEGNCHSAATGYDRCEHLPTEKDEICKTQNEVQSGTRLLKLNSFNEDEYIRPLSADGDLEEGELDEDHVSDDLKDGAKRTEESTIKETIMNTITLKASAHTVLKSIAQIDKIEFPSFGTESSLIPAEGCADKSDVAISFSQAAKFHGDRITSSPVPPFVTSPDHGDNGSVCGQTATSSIKCPESIQCAIPTDGDCSVVGINKIEDNYRRVDSSSRGPPSIVEVEFTSEVTSNHGEKKSESETDVCLSVPSMQHCISVHCTENDDISSKFKNQKTDDNGNTYRLKSSKGSKKWRAIQAGREMSSIVASTHKSDIKISPSAVVVSDSINNDYSKKSIPLIENIKYSQTVDDSHVRIRDKMTDTAIEIDAVALDVVKGELSQSSTATEHPLRSVSKSIPNYEKTLIKTSDIAKNTSFRFIQENVSTSERAGSYKKPQVHDSQITYKMKQSYFNDDTTKAAQDCSDTSLVSPGCRVAIDRDRNGEYIAGTVTKLLPGKKRGFRIKYEDGEKEWVNLNVTHFRLMSSGGQQSSFIQKQNQPVLTEKLEDGCTRLEHPEPLYLKEPVITKKCKERESSTKPVLSYLDRFKYKASVEKLKEQTKVNNRAFATLAKLNYLGEKKEKAVPKISCSGDSKQVTSTKVKRKDPAGERESLKKTEVVRDIFKKRTHVSTVVKQPSPRVEEDWVTAGSKSYNSDSDTDDEEVMEWGSKLFGVPIKQNLSFAYQRNAIVPVPKAIIDEEQRKRKEEARSLTTAEIRAILGDDSGGDYGDISSHWVRRSSRQPCKSALQAPKLLSLLAKLRNNDSDMVVLKMKKYCPDSATPSIVVDTVLDALEENSNCEALYIQVR